MTAKHPPVEEPGLSAPTVLRLWSAKRWVPRSRAETVRANTQHTCRVDCPHRSLRSTFPTSRRQSFGEPWDGYDAVQLDLTVPTIPSADSAAEWPAAAHRRRSVSGFAIRSSASSRSMRLRICPKRLRVNWLSASLPLVNRILAGRKRYDLHGLIYRG